MFSMRWLQLVFPVQSVHGLFEGLSQRRPLVLHGGRQQTTVHSKGVGMKVDVLHLKNSAHYNVRIYMIIA